MSDAALSTGASDDLFLSPAAGAVDRLFLPLDQVCCASLLLYFGGGRPETILCESGHAIGVVLYTAVHVTTEAMGVRANGKPKGDWLEAGEGDAPGRLVYPGGNP